MCECQRLCLQESCISRKQGTWIFWRARFSRGSEPPWACHNFQKARKQISKCEKTNFKRRKIKFQMKRIRMTRIKILKNASTSTYAKLGSFSDNRDKELAQSIDDYYQGFKEWSNFDLRETWEFFRQQRQRACTEHRWLCRWRHPLKLICACMYVCTYVCMYVM